MNGRLSLILYEQSSIRKPSPTSQLYLRLQPNNFNHRVKLPKSFVAVNLSDAFSLEKQSGDDETDEGGLEMRLTHARAKEEHITAAQGLVSAINEAATAADDDVPRV